jgi:hypothetical protein
MVFVMLSVWSLLAGAWLRWSLPQQRSLHASAARSSAGLVHHRPVQDNSPDMKWEFSAENGPVVKDILAKFPNNYKASAVMPLLVSHLLAAHLTAAWTTTAQQSTHLCLCRCATCIGLVRDAGADRLSHRSSTAIGCRWLQ